MVETTQRLERAAAVLALIDERRTATGDCYLGSNIERMILERELRELEEEAVANSGPLESLLAAVRLRKRR